MDKTSPIILGEVLFDCFPDGKQVLGGAPFNVAWNLQAFGDKPGFVSRIGDDSEGREIHTAMQDWGMDTAHLQTDPEHRSGRVAITINDGEPAYDIMADCAYDFIDAGLIAVQPVVLYHGTLALRSPATRAAYEALADKSSLIFMDVNLREPWWERKQVLALVDKAHWVKLNEDEFRLLSGDEMNSASLAEFQAAHAIDTLIVTRGAKGAWVRQADGTEFAEEPVPADKFVDTVGAGDALASVCLHGLLQGWALPQTLQAAQAFASAVVGLRGAITRDADFYRQFDFVNEG